MHDHEVVLSAHEETVLRDLAAMLRREDSWLAAQLAGSDPRATRSAHRIRLLMPRVVAGLLLIVGAALAAMTTGPVAYCSVLAAAAGAVFAMRFALRAHAAEPASFVGRSSTVERTHMEPAP